MIKRHAACFGIGANEISIAERSRNKALTAPKVADLAQNVSCHTLSLGMDENTAIALTKPKRMSPASQPPSPHHMISDILDWAARMRSNRQHLRRSSRRFASSA